MGWTTVGNIRGPQGDDGTAATIAVGTVTTGDAGSDAAVTNSGDSSAAVFDFTIPKGDKGDPGQSVTIVGHVDTSDDLPDDLGPDDAGKGYLTDDDGHLHVWSGSAYIDVGNIRGPAGADGGTGPAGGAGDAATISVGTVTTVDPGDAATVTNTGSTSAAVLAFNIPKGAKGDAGDSVTGDTGATGPRGSKWFTGSGAPGTVAGSVAGDFYLDTDSGDTYELS
jgi:hypothetical protein